MAPKPPNRPPHRSSGKPSGKGRRFGGEHRGGEHRGSDPGAGTGAGTSRHGAAKHPRRGPGPRHGNEGKLKEKQWNRRDERRPEEAQGERRPARHDYAGARPRPKDGGQRPRFDDEGRRSRREDDRGQRPRFDEDGQRPRYDEEGQRPRHKDERRRPRFDDEGHRPRSGEGWIYGHHAVAAALANPARRLERLVVTSDAAETLARAGLGGRISPEIRAGQEIAALLPEGAVHQGYALKAAALPERNIDDVLAGLAEGAPALVVVLDQVTDPRNVGAILRSAAAFGVAAVLLPERHGADTTAALAKAASGALETVALVRVTNVSRALESLKAGGFWCVGLDAHAAEPLSTVDLSGRIALVLGSEGAGLRRLVADTCDFRAKLPISGAMDSLNVSAAAAIAMYEVARRRAN